ncbi:hypothetical protein EDB84DRAFT_1568548 [Lactarius hengduanensis]|nr:hypothetical protein EDB84DRAFT_1568548 [Lactarius hengduanensis]
MPMPAPGHAHRTHYQPPSVEPVSSCESIILPIPRAADAHPDGLANCRVLDLASVAPAAPLMPTPAPNIGQAGHPPEDEEVGQEETHEMSTHTSRREGEVLEITGSDAPVEDAVGEAEVDSASPQAQAESPKDAPTGPHRLRRLFSGALNGNVGVLKSVLAELADESNVARAFSFLPLVFVVGQVIGFGLLNIYPFWAEYPYFLPCLVVASFSLIQFTIAGIFFEGTLGRKTSARSSPQERACPQQQDEEHAEQPLPLRSLLTKPVVISIANYGTLALLEIATSGAHPAHIDLWMSAYGCVSAVFQFAFFPRVVAHFGPGRVVIATVVAFGLLYALFPFENMLACGMGTASVVWLLIALH